MADVHCGCPPDQALERYKDTAVSESERIEEQFEDLIAGLDLDAPLTFHVGLDVKAAQHLEGALPGHRGAPRHLSTIFLKYLLISNI